MLFQQYSGSPSRLIDMFYFYENANNIVIAFRILVILDLISCAAVPVFCFSNRKYYCLMIPPFVILFFIVAAASLFLFCWGCYL